MEKKEVVSLLISLKTNISISTDIDSTLKNEAMTLVSASIDEASKSEGVELTSSIGRLVNKMSFLIGFKGLKFNSETEQIWGKISSIDIDRKKDLNNSSFIYGGVSSIFKLL